MPQETRMNTRSITQSALTQHITEPLPKNERKNQTPSSAPNTSNKKPPSSNMETDDADPLPLTNPMEDDLEENQQRITANFGANELD